MPGEADTAVKLATIRQIELQRVAVWMAGILNADIDELGDAIARAARDADPAGAGNIRSQQAALRALLREVNRLIGDAESAITTKAEGWIGELAEIQAADEKRIFLLAFGLALFGAALAAKEFLVMGLPVENHLSAVMDGISRRAEAAIRSSVAAVEDASKLYQRLKTEVPIKAAVPPAPVVIAKKQIETVMRTATTGVQSQQAGEMKPKASVVGEWGWQHISVLDNRTTETCRKRAWKRWDKDRKPVGHTFPYAEPPIHENCRSVIRLVFLDQPEPERVTLSQFINGLTPAERAEVFGQALINAWERGRITDSELLRQASRPLSIEELRARTI